MTKQAMLARIRKLMAAVGGVPDKMADEWNVETVYGVMRVHPILDFGGGSGFIALRFDDTAAIKRHLGVPQSDNGVYGHSLHGRGINLYSGKWNICLRFEGRRGKANIERAAMWNELLNSLEAVLPEPARQRAGDFAPVDIGAMLEPLES